MAEITTRADRAELTRVERRKTSCRRVRLAAEALEEYLLVLRDDPENDKVGELAADEFVQNRGRDAMRLLGELSSGR